ncbi:MAG: hypothetical protein GEU99_16960 [Luteitalea sp.]|nr:hypothetical protein [Luteitalea sp.]
MKGLGTILPVPVAEGVRLEMYDDQGRLLGTTILACAPEERDVVFADFRRDLAELSTQVGQVIVDHNNPVKGH